jgi:hypothetical protein
MSPSGFPDQRQYMAIPRDDDSSVEVAHPADGFSYCVISTPSQSGSDTVGNSQVIYTPSSASVSSVRSNPYQDGEDVTERDPLLTGLSPPPRYKDSASAHPRSYPDTRKDGDNVKDKPSGSCNGFSQIPTGKCDDASWTVVKDEPRSEEDEEVVRRGCCSRQSCQRRQRRGRCCRWSKRKTFLVLLKVALLICLAAWLFRGKCDGSKKTKVRSPFDFWVCPEKGFLRPSLTPC